MATAQRNPVAMLLLIVMVAMTAGEALASIARRPGCMPWIACASCATTLSTALANSHNWPIVQAPTHSTSTFHRSPCCQSASR